MIIKGAREKFKPIKLILESRAEFDSMLVALSASKELSKKLHDESTRKSICFDEYWKHSTGMYCQMLDIL